MSDPIEDLIVRVRAGYVPNKNETNILLRACLRARPGHVLICCDYSQVEARWNAWASDDHDALEVFQSKIDPYSVLAGKLWATDPAEIARLAKDLDPPDPVASRQRDTGKKAELGCGYGMGAAKFQVTAEKGGMVWSPPEACPEHGEQCTDPLCGALTDNGRHEFTHGAYTIVQTWRALHEPIVTFWYAIERAVKTATKGGRATAGPYEAAKIGGDVWIALPSGRPLVYRDMRLVGAGRDAKLRYIHRGGDDKPPGPRHTYGGSLCENVTQAACRDLLARAMARCEAEGIPIVLHVHDELVAEVPARDADLGLAVIKEIMLDLPDWAPGFPVKVSGLITERYRKG